MKNKVGLFHLVCIGLAGIIGSGWLFASMYAAQTAGTGAFLAWIIGALLMLAVASCLSELASLYPRRGLLASICSYSHNKDFAFIIAIANWFGTLCVIPSEAVATVRYLNWDTWAVIPLILVYAILNSWGVKLFTKFNTWITIFKFIVPTLTVIALLWHGVKMSHFHGAELLNIHHVMMAVIAGGVIYGFNGCQMIVNFTSEAKNPQRNIPAALFISLGISVLLYLLLQFAYIGTANIAINYRDPFIQLALTLGLGWLVLFLQVDAAVSPSGTGFMYMSSCTRMLTAMSREGQMPQELGVKSERYNMSHRSLIVNFIISVGLFLVFKTWENLVIVVSSFHIISYLAAPLALGRLRLTMPKTERAFRLPLQWVICPFLFFVLSYLFTTASFHTDIYVAIICVFFLAVYIVLNYRKPQEIIHAISRASFLPIWLVLFALCAKLHLSAWYILAFSLVMYFIGVGSETTLTSLDKPSGDTFNIED
jgi:amino acid transporter